MRGKLLEMLDNFEEFEQSDLDELTPEELKELEDEYNMTLVEDTDEMSYLTQIPELTFNSEAYKNLTGGQILNKRKQFLDFAQDLVSFLIDNGLFIDFDLNDIFDVSDWWDSPRGDYPEDQLHTNFIVNFKKVATELIDFFKEFYLDKDNLEEFEVNISEDSLKTLEGIIDLLSDLLSKLHEVSEKNEKDDEFQINEEILADSREYNEEDTDGLYVDEDYVTANELLMEFISPYNHLDLTKNEIFLLAVADSEGSEPHYFEATQDLDEFCEYYEPKGEFTISKDYDSKYLAIRDELGQVVKIEKHILTEEQEEEILFAMNTFRESGIVSKLYYETEQVPLEK